MTEPPLPDVPLDEADVDELVREVRRAFAFNAAVFDELAA